jgi:hypothetical protein
METNKGQKYAEPYELSFTTEMISIFTLWTFYLNVATFQLHLNCMIQKWWNFLWTRTLSKNELWDYHLIYMYIFVLNFKNSG